MTLPTSQQSQFDLLRAAYRQGRLSHAYLLSGVAGLGKTNFARQFANFLLCNTLESSNVVVATQMEVKAQATSKPCGQCRACQQFAAKTHPDFIFIAPHEKSHAIKIDQIRELSQQLSQTAHHGGYQVVIISPADAMPIAAANALLKTLEEPAGKVIIFLIDNLEHPLPTTIASRCQKINFYAGAINAVIKKQDIALRDQLVKHLMQLSEHRINPIAPVVNWIKHDLAMMLDILLLCCVDISRQQFHASADHLIYTDNHEALLSVSKKISPMQLQQFLELILEKKSMVAKGINLNTQLCLENIFIEWERLHCVSN